MSTYGKLSSLLINSTSMAFSSLEVQWRIIQTKLCPQFFSLCLKRSVLQIFKSSSCIKRFPKCVFVIGKTCLDECFSLHAIIWRHYFLQKFVVTQRLFATTILLHSLKEAFWMKSVFYARYFHNNTKANTKGSN